MKMNKHAEWHGSTMNIQKTNDDPSFMPTNRTTTMMKDGLVVRLLEIKKASTIPTITYHKMYIHSWVCFYCEDGHFYVTQQANPHPMSIASSTHLDLNAPQRVTIPLTSHKKEFKMKLSSAIDSLTYHDAQWKYNLLGLPVTGTTMSLKPRLCEHFSLKLKHAATVSISGSKQSKALSITARPLLEEKSVTVTPIGSPTSSDGMASP